MTKSARHDLVRRHRRDFLVEKLDAPDFGRSSPEIVRNVVVFPAPFPPMSVTIAPGSILKEIPPSAEIAP
jgi:hypothetical protein